MTIGLSHKNSASIIRLYSKIIVLARRQLHSRQPWSDSPPLTVLLERLYNQTEALQINSFRGACYIKSTRTLTTCLKVIGSVSRFPIFVDGPPHTI